MSFRRLLFSFVLCACLIPSLAFAKTYKCVDIYTGDIDTANVIFKSGDKISAQRGLTVDLAFKGPLGDELGSSKGEIKSYNINGKKCSEWKLTGVSGAYMQIGRILQGSFYYTMTPAYLSADADGYFTLSSDTYEVYQDAASTKGRNVKLSGNVEAISGNLAFISVADSEIIACMFSDANSNSAVIGDRIQAKGSITESVEYQDANVPTVSLTSFEKKLYDPLKKGDSGENVLNMKLRMQELGYFTAGADLSDVYNDTCVERVKQFQSKNGLDATGNADIDTLSLLFSDSAKIK